MLRIKKKYLGKKIEKGVQTYTLSNQLTQKQLLHIKNMVSADYVEEFNEVKLEKKDKKNVINS